MFILGMLVGIALVFIFAYIVVRKKFNIKSDSLVLQDLFDEEDFSFKESDFED